jgi:hypothetical protein
MTTELNFSRQCNLLENQAVRTNSRAGMDNYSSWVREKKAALDMTIQGYL